MTQEPTAVATVPKQSIEQLLMQRAEPSAIMQAYEAANEVQRARIAAEASAAIAKISWGEKLPQDVRHHVARWCLSHRIDPERHIFVLGNRVYDNAEFYIDRAAESGMVQSAERIIMAPLDNRKLDPAFLDEDTVAALRAEQVAINRARLQLQIRHAVPENINDFPDTAAAVLIRVHLLDGRTFEGWNMAGSRGRRKQTRNGPGGTYDPVGDQEPVKTATTRAWRKACKDWIPFTGSFGDDGVAVQQLERIEERIEQERERSDANPPEGLLDGQKKFLEVAPGLHMRSNEGDRLSGEALEATEHGLASEKPPAGGVEGIRQVDGGTEEEAEIRKEDKELAS